MREIKFRYTFKRKDDGHIWQLTNVGIESIESLCSELSFMLDNELWEIVSRDEWTGLTDKHGKDVYEGDIVDICDGIDTKAVVAWNAECASFACDYIGDDSWSGHLFGCELVEVIGNIYENPELLEAN